MYSRLQQSTLVTLFSAIAVIGVLFALPIEALAQGSDFVPIQEVPNVIEKKTTFADFVNGIFWAAVIAGAMLAVIMISIGGFEYMGGESVFSKESGKEKIRDAVLGLILILLTVVIFSTINPDILNLRLDIQDTEDTPAVDISAPDLGGERRTPVENPDPGPLEGSGETI